MAGLDHASRAQGIGSSEIAVIAGLSKYGSPMAIWLEKKHGIREEVDSYHIERGNHLEASLLGWYQERIRRELADRGATVIVDCENCVHPHHDIVRATPDGLLTLTYPGCDAAPAGWADTCEDDLPGPPSDWADRVVEIKAPSSTTWRDWGVPGTADIPLYHLPQVTWEMAATGVHRCDVAALVNDDLTIYHVEFSHDLFDKLLAIAQDWWQCYIIGDREPPPDASSGYRDYLERRYPRVVRPDLDVAGGEEDELIAQYAAVRRDLKALDTEKSRLANAIKRALGDRDGFQGGAGKARWYETNGKSTIDLDAMAADGIDVSQYRRPGKPYRKIGVWEAKT